MNPAHKFEEAIARSLAAWQDEREASAAKIQALLSEGLEMMRERDQARRERDQARRERDQARREAAAWREGCIEAGALLGSVAGR